MTPVRAEFVQPVLPSKRAWLLVGFLWLVAVGALGWAWYENLRANDAQRRLESARQLAVNAERARPFAAPPPPAPYDASAREMLRERSTPWPMVLRSLEVTAMVGITVRSIDMNASEAIVRVEVDFNNHKTLLEYLDSLNAGLPGGGPAWHWVLVHAQLETSAGGVAQLVARWGR